MATLAESLNTVVRIFRRECHRVLQSERTTIHGADGMLMVLQLAIAEVNKQESGEFGVALSEVLMAWKCLLQDKLHLPHEEALRPENYELIRKEYECFLKRTNTVDLIDVYSMFKQLRVATDPEEPLTSMQLLAFLSGNTVSSEERDSFPPCPVTPSSKPRPCSSQVQRAVRRHFCSYLDLLVNSKNDVALARTLNTPDRSLGRAAFTDLKHAARSNTTSLFLTVTSFVRAIQLGGKGYAPPESDPLRKHLKGLSEFVNFTDQLEELLGESPDPSVAGARLLSSIRAALLKGRGTGDPLYAAAEETARDLKERVGQIRVKLKESATETGISPARPRVRAINHATALGGRDTVKVLLAMLDEEAVAAPCGNKAELLSEDQAVLNGAAADGTCLLSLYRSPEASTGSSPKPLRDRVQAQQEHVKSEVRERVIRSQFACTYQDEDLPLNRVLDFPSTSQVPTCVHPAPKQTPVTDEEGRHPAGLEHLPTEVSTRAAAGREQGGLAQRSVLGARGGNARRRAGGEGGAAAVSPRTGSSKRKLAEGGEQGGEENQPPLKKPPRKAPYEGLGKKKPSNGKAPSKKLIAGQGKLTGFFRL